MPEVYPNGFDAHTHLDFPEFDTDRAQVCARSVARGVTGWAIAGAAPEHWGRARAVADAIGAILTLGVHPWWVPALGPDALAEALRALETARMDGLGECGLDHHRAREPDARATQRDVLRAQLAIARDRDLPIVVHCVRAHADLLGILRADGVPRAGGLMHGWSGSPEEVGPFVALGLHVSFGLRALRPDAAKVREAARRVPPDRVLLETDAPDGVPGTRMEPAQLRDVAEAIATVRGEDADAVLARAGASARALWGLA